MKVLIYNGHSGGTGGGENHAAGIIALLKDYYDVTVMLDKGKESWFEEVPRYFGWDLSGVKHIPFNPLQIAEYDQFININHGLILPPLARRNILMCFFPQNRWDTNGYDTIITNSNFTRGHIADRWQRNLSDIYTVYPPINVDEFKANAPKKKQIMTIGRFFHVPDGNNKNHEFMINAFMELEDPDLKFVIVGGIQNYQYFEKCRKLAERDPRIEFRHDLTRQEIIDLYAESDIYWHAAGYGTDIPSSMEHFGMVAVEAQASGTIPLVHNSGGIPETGARVWETEEQLLILTEEVLRMKRTDRRKVSKEQKQRVAELFHPDVTQRKLLEVMERPIAVYRPTNAGFQTPISTPTINPREIKVGIIGDAPNITTGFGVVSRMFGKGFISKGFQVTQIGLQDSNHEPRADEWRIWRPGHQPLTPEFVKEWLEKDRTNVLWLNYDAGNIASWLNILAAMKCDIPVIAYFPIEGFPIPNGFIDMSRLIAKPVTYLKWGSDLMFEQSGLRVDWVPHGVDHANFKRFDEAHRQKLKADVGWQNRFVVGFFGRNKRTKQQPRLIETMAMLKRQGVGDSLVLYLHCQPFEGHMMNGWNLRDIVNYNDVADMVAFPPENSFQQVQGIDYEATRQIPPELIERIDFDTPEGTAQARGAILSSYSMIERYNMCDLFITVSQAEGFNLPLGEAMACGVPIISVDDDGTQREVADGAAEFIPPIEWDTWHIGTLLPIVSKRALAEKIVAIMNDPDLRKTMSDNSLKAAARYKWSETTNSMNQIVIDTLMKARS